MARRNLPRRAVSPLQLASRVLYSIEDRAECTAKKEAKLAEKLAKQALKAVTPTNAQPFARKEKKEKEKKEVAPVEEWVNTTPKGEKKGELTPVSALPCLSLAAGKQS